MIALVCLTLLPILFYVQSLLMCLYAEAYIHRKKPQPYINKGIFGSLCYILILTIFSYTECDNFSLAGKRTLVNVPKKRFSS